MYIYIYTYINTYIHRERERERETDREPDESSSPGPLQRLQSPAGIRAGKIPASTDGGRQRALSSADSVYGLGLRVSAECSFWWMEGV